MKPQQWSTAIVVIHWVTVLLVVGLVAVGFTMVGLADDDPLRRVLGRAHALGGLTVGLLTLTRLVLRQMGPRPEPLALPAPQRRLADVVQALVYLALFGLGASGVGTALGSDWSSFVSGALDRAPALDALLSRRVHVGVAAALLVLIGLHVAGVALHQVRAGGVLKRMLPGRRAR